MIDLKVIEGDSLLRDSKEFARSQIDLPVSVVKTVQAMLGEIRSRGETAVREFASKFDGLLDNAPLVLSRKDLQKAAATVVPADWRLLEQVALRIQTLAAAQTKQLSKVKVDIDGGYAGVRYQPVAVAGCYAPAGRYPLPSSMLMTAVTAKAAGVSTILAASPRLTPIMGAAALVGGVDYLLPFGGAPAISAMASGILGTPAADVIVGPGNQYVTAAKNILGCSTRMDMPAGPSEIALVGDESTDLHLAAADLIAQAEHDPFARVYVVALNGFQIDSLGVAVNRQLELLPASNRTVAGEALANALIIRCSATSMAQDVVNLLAPEHLSLQLKNPHTFLERVSNYGVVLIGALTPVALADYGAGPNHTLPTGGSARSWGGLTVVNFLRPQFELEIKDSFSALELFDQAERLACIEGLSGHAASLLARQKAKPDQVQKLRTGAKIPDPADVILDSNELPFPPLPELRSSYEMSFSQLNRYPDTECKKLKAAIARYVGVDAGSVTCGNGSDELLRLATQLFVPVGGSILTLWPTFGQYARLAEQLNARLIQVPWEIAAIPGELAGLIEAEKPDLSILTRPNSPCGRLIPKEVIIGLKGKVLIDEAYIDFSGDSILTNLLLDRDEGENGTAEYMVLRTLSKGWGLAGLRLGWLVSSREVIRMFDDARDPFNCDLVSQSVAAAAFSLIVDGSSSAARRMKNQIALINNERTRMFEKLLSMGFDCKPSAANFLWITLPAASRWQAELRNRGIAVRYLSYPYKGVFRADAGREGIRVTVGLPRENNLFLAAMEDLL